MRFGERLFVLWLAAMVADAISAVTIKPPDLWSAVYFQTTTILMVALTETQWWKRGVRRDA